MAYRCPYCGRPKGRHETDCGRRRYRTREAAPIDPERASPAERAARKADLLRLALACEQGWREDNARRERGARTPMRARGAGS